MLFEDYLDAVGLELVVRRYANQQGRWTASIDGAEVMSEPPGMLESLYGTGANAGAAAEDYVKKVRGRRIVLHAWRDDRREYAVPESVQW